MTSLAHYLFSRGRPRRFAAREDVNQLFRDTADKYVAGLPPEHRDRVAADLPEFHSLDHFGYLMGLTRGKESSAIDVTGRLLYGTENQPTGTLFIGHDPTKGTLAARFFSSARWAALEQKKDEKGYRRTRKGHVRDRSLSSFVDESGREYEPTGSQTRELRTDKRGKPSRQSTDWHTVIRDAIAATGKKGMNLTGLVVGPKPVIGLRYDTVKRLVDELVDQGRLVRRRLYIKRPGRGANLTTKLYTPENHPRPPRMEKKHNIAAIKKRIAKPDEDLARRIVAGVGRAGKTGLGFGRFGPLTSIKGERLKAIVDDLVQSGQLVARKSAGRTGPVGTKYYLPKHDPGEFVDPSGKLTEKVRQLRAEGKSYRQIQAITGLSPSAISVRITKGRKRMARTIHPAIRVRLARAAALWRHRYSYLPPEGHGVPGLPGGPPGAVPASHVVTYRHRDTGAMLDHFVHGTRGPYAAIESLKRAGHSVRGIRPAEPEEVEQYLDVKRTAKLVRLGWLRRYAPVPKPAPAAPRSVAYRPGIKPPAKVIQRPKSLAGGPGRVGPAGRKPVIGPRGKSALPIARPPRPGPVIGPSGRPVVPAFRQPPPRTPIGTSPVIGPSGKPIRPPLGGSKTSDFGPFLDPKVAHNLEYSAHILRNIFGGRKARRYAAYKAPAKGIAVRGSFYPGGEFLPNLDKFANPENARRGALKARARAARRRKKSGNALAMAQALGLN